MAYRGGNITFYNHSNRTAVDPAVSAFDYCHSLYLQSRILVPSLHAMVTALGLYINLYMMRVLFHETSASRSGSPRGSHVQYFLYHIGLCNMCMLSFVPVWATQTVFAQGWIFREAGCKAVKGLMTFSLQYGILIVVYINGERFMRVVYNKPALSCLKWSEIAKRRTACLMCSCIPAVSCFTDMYFYTVVEMGKGIVMCINVADPHMKLALLWIRTTICFFAPVAALALCNGAVMYAVKKHVRKVRLAHSSHQRQSLRGAQIIPLVTVAFFICCWIPWIVSSVYYSFVRARCPVTMFTVINVSLAVGNMHCVITPAMYLFVKTGKTRVGSGNTLRSSSSLRCA